MRKVLYLWILSAGALCAQSQVRFRFDADDRRWTLSNGLIETVFSLTPADNFQLDRFSDLRSGAVWRGADSSPLRFTIDDTAYGAATGYRLMEQTVTDLGKGGFRQRIVLEDLNGQVQVRLSLDMYEGQPVLRQRVSIRNLASRPVRVRSADMLPYRFADGGRRFRVFRVFQWAVAPQEQNFGPLESPLDPKNGSVIVESGARGLHCAWMVLRDAEDRGLFSGWEFDGRAEGEARQADGKLRLSASILDLSHPLQPGDEFRVPPAFLGSFQGDWDEAGYRTQRFTENVLAKPIPDPERFPYVAWDSWGYGATIDEVKLRHEAENAARLGVELFVVDLGWANKIGDWRADPRKFPSGLRSLSDYVHELGMKFGVHFALAEAAPDAPVLLEHPDWTSSETYGYFGALSLCLSNQETQQWLIDQAVRMIEDYNVDWILQDGENMVKRCTKSTHTHDPADSNYSNSVLGLNAVLAEIQRRKPAVLWENCENGGNMMTFNMVQYYVTSITNDASSSLGARQAVFGATYPFPPRYANRYMGDEKLDSYTTRSFLFGGPWIFMNRLSAMKPDDLAFAASEIRLFKTIRTRIRDGKVYRLTERPEEDRIDAIQSYHEPTDSAIAIVTRDGGESDSFILRPRGLKVGGLYRVRFQDDTRILTITGDELMRVGVTVRLPLKKISEIVYIDPLQLPDSDSLN